MPQLKLADLLARIEILEQSLNTLTEGVKGIEDRLVGGEQNIQSTEPTTSTGVPSVTPEKKDENPKFRELVNEVLNKNFEFVIEDGHNAAFFRFVVLVPEVYSNAGKAHWDFYHKDERPGNITYNQADLMIKDHLERVLNNFSSDMKAVIANDRK